MTWRGIPAAGVQTGRAIAIPAVAAGATASIAVTFQQAYPAIPIVLPVPHNFRLTVSTPSVTTDGFTATFANWSPGDAAASSFDWVAYPA